MDLMAIRRRVMKVSKKSRLPSAYQEVEWIKSTGTQWIDTGIIPNNQITIQLKVMNLGITGDTILGYWKTNDDYSMRLFNAGGGLYFDTIKGSGYSGRLSVSNAWSANVIVEFEAGNTEGGYQYVKDLQTDTIIRQKQGQRYAVGIDTIKLNYYNDSKISKNQWYYVKLIDNGQLLIDIVPCYRKTDGEIGMYDLMSDTFLTNQGAGTFLKGADI